MNRKRWNVVAMAAIACAGSIAVVSGGIGQASSPPALVEQVQDATRSFKDVNNAIAAGYGSLGSCVSGPQEGAMGVHFGKAELIGDGAIDAANPELLVYEQKGGKMRLLGVEYLVIASDWDAAHTTPPILVGQHFQFVSSPNRYQLPAFYELHVWAWKNNSNGTFVDWNPAVSCDDYTGS
jgi:hypothetical protein